MIFSPRHSRNLFQKFDIHVTGVLSIPRKRILWIIITYCFINVIMIGRLFELTVLRGSEASITYGVPLTGRANIIDDQGEVVATTLKTSSVYGNPQIIPNPKKAVHQLGSIIPHIKPLVLEKKIRDGKTFVWIARHITPQQRERVLQLGIPGVSFMEDQRRIYPHGSLLSHILGYTNIDNQGIAGIEKTMDEKLRSRADPVQITIDLRMQHIVRDELKKAIEKFSAQGAAGILIDIKTGAIKSLVSLPDFNPNRPHTATPENMFNKVTLGMYEMGSTMKIANTAMGLHSKAVHLGSLFDTSAPLKIGRFTITDYRANHGTIDVANIFVHSSNKGSARIALAAGVEKQKKFLKSLGYLDPVKLELPEIGYPIVPKQWGEAQAITISYGYGLSISPIHLAKSTLGIVSGSIKNLTVLKKNILKEGVAVVTPDISKIMLQLMRYVVLDGTSKKANVPGYFVGAKTGTRNMLVGGHYRKDQVATSFVGVFGQKAEEPLYVLVVLLENPKAIKETHGFTTAGWNCAPTAGKIISRLGPLLGIAPTYEDREPLHPFFKNKDFSKKH
jgi:cell division protein FtsI (penicillin-binding protein 3)